MAKTDMRDKQFGFTRKATFWKSSTQTMKRAWFKENDPEGVAFKHKLGPRMSAGSAD